MLTTCIALSLGCKESGFYSALHLNTIAEIMPAKIVLAGIILFAAYRWNKMRLLKYLNYGLIVICVLNAVAIYMA
jgi:multisubunit Na+/H+ antiporter MnhG subunit